jgi:hypothetical protein
VDVITERRRRIDRLNDVAREVARMGGGEAHPADSRNASDGGQQIGEAHAAGGIAPGVDILAEKLDVGIALLGHAPGLDKHRG